MDSDIPIPSLEAIIGEFSVSVLDYRSAQRPNLKAQVHVRHPSGKVERSFFEDRIQAEEHKALKLAEIKAISQNAINLDARIRIEVIGLMEMVRPFDVTLTEVGRFFVSHHAASTCTVSEVCENFMASRRKKGLRPRSMSTLKQILTRFRAAMGEAKVSTLTPDKIEDWIHGLGVAPVSINSYRRLLNGVFEYAKARKMTRENPVAAIEIVKEQRGKVGILTIDQMRALLNAAAGEPDILATLAIGGFAGLRPDEIARLKWIAVDLAHGQIDCGSEITKTASHRYVKIEPVLAAWLGTIPAMGGLESAWGGPDSLIQGESFARRYRSVREAAGFVINAKQEGLAWPHDALRHSFGSYHYAHFKDAAQTATQLGHSDTAMLFANYRSRVKDVDADAWWNLFPEGK